MKQITDLVGRILLAHIFLLAGLNKIGAYAATQGYMESMGVPGMLLPLVIILEIAGGITLIIGWKTRITALLLAGFTIIAAVIFHSNLSEQMQMILFMKNFAIAGGLLYLSGNGAGVYSLDDRTARTAV